MKPEQSREVTTFAGGCFWCTEAIFQRLQGVISVKPGYTGGSLPNPTYEAICDGNTGHAEAIQIEFFPNQITYDTLLEVFFATHDPTTLNRQGNDVGTQYRSAVFFHSPEQQRAAQQYIDMLNEQHAYADPIVTEVTKFTEFFEAEDYHQNYYNTHKDAGYCSLIISPKIHKLLEKFGHLVKEE